MELSTDRIAAQLAGEPLRPAYLLAGAETLLVLEAADAVRAAARAQGIGEREVFDMEGRDADWDALDAAIHAPSLFASRRLVEVRLPTGKPGAAGAKMLVAYCAAPPPDVVLLVIAGEWSRQHAGKWSEAMEGNLLAAAREVDKLVLLAGGEASSAPLDAERMDALVADSARFDVFRLADAALNGHPPQVSRMLAGLRAEGEVVPALMGMLVKELQTAATLARARNFATECKALRVWDSKQASYKRALARHPPERWQRFLVEAGRVDRIAKGRVRAGEESADPWVQLERLLLGVAEPSALRLLAR